MKNPEYISGDLESGLIQSDWELIARGGDNQGGNFGGRGFCPCQKEYTVQTRQSVHQQRPNQQQIAACMANPPAPDPAYWDCPEDCVQIMTHIWHGWTIVRHRRNGLFKLNCSTSAQYHCKRPDDPARDQDPHPGPPPPDIES